LSLVQRAMTKSAFRYRSMFIIQERVSPVINVLSQLVHAHARICSNYTGVCKTGWRFSDRMFCN